MALNIKSPEAEKDVRRLAELTGESLTEAMHKAVRERLERLSAEDESAKTARWAEINALIKEIQSAPVLDPRSPDAIIGYNDQGSFD